MRAGQGGETRDSKAPEAALGGGGHGQVGAQPGLLPAPSGGTQPGLSALPLLRKGN